MNVNERKKWTVLIGKRMKEKLMGKEREGSQKVKKLNNVYYS